MEVNIISVEKAIQRELDYRKKIAHSLSEAEIASLLPLELPSSSKVTTLVGSPTYSLGQSSISASRPRPESHLISSLMVSANEVTSSIPNLKPSPMLPAEPTHERQNFISPPRPCPAPGSISRPTIASAKAMTPSVSDLKPSSLPNQNPSPFMGPTQNPASIYPEMARQATTHSLNHIPNQKRRPYYNNNGPNMFCNICQVRCSGPLCYKKHVKGHKHKAKLSYLQLSSNGVVKQSKKEQPRCDLCQILCSDETSLDLHFKGQKHREKLQAIELGKKQKTPQHFWCELCHVPCNNEENFRMHLKGKNHAAQLFAFEKQRKAI